ncbi:TonB-dependent receptor [Aerosticca soli]|uniref:Oar protein n=1 Tax=Aerosticca soli TaxID=2010829 RepID=A0A2Z6E8S5_9GAMM|nr:TonB-dependent receptor [Aerosticca soli]BBD81184.1 Oar protein [Aerosticca soli]
MGKNTKTMPLRRTALAIAVGLGFGATAYAQSTTGSIAGQAPAAPGETVVITSATGLSREVQVDNTGRYRVDNLPVGTYTVSLKRDGAVISTQEGVRVSSGGSTGINFTAASPTQSTQLGAVTVSANAMPPIDVSSVNSSTIITAADLARLPLDRSAEAIALLAPGAVQGSGYFANAVAFGGSSVSENAYYVNGYNTGEPYRNIGGFQLPYGAIEQQETLTGGYDAKYGRSDGGVINQVGKRGTNDWHFGAQVLWQPKFLQANPRNIHYVNPALPAPTDELTYQVADPTLGTRLHRYREDDKKWETVYSAYLGGPLIKDKLFMFLAVDTTKDNYTTTGFDTAKNITHSEDTDTKFYGKIDWNITDSNIFEFTYLKNNQTTNKGSIYSFDYNTLKSGAYLFPSDEQKDNAEFFIGHYTSYITDDLTLSILYGKAKFQNPTYYGNHSTLPYIRYPELQDPSKLPPGADPVTGVNNAQTNRQWYSDDARNGTHGLRVDLDYKLGDHDLAVGIDNMYYKAHNQGPTQYNPWDPSIDYFWQYRANGTVRKYSIGWETSMTMRQKAYYAQDTWQITPSFLLKVGVRNDHFTNYNDRGIAFVDEKNQWEPRIGASWDVFGDSTLKVYGNAGRYYLALPDNAAERAANISTYTYTTYSYTSIDTNGIPQGLTPLTGVLSPDGEFGLPKDPKQVTARNLKPEYLDEYILGFDKQLGEDWVYGAKGTWRDLKQAIDDECSAYLIAEKMTKMGLNPDNYSDSIYGPAYCRLINPGKTNNMLVVSNDGKSSVLVPMHASDWGYTQGVKRKIGSLNLYLEHPFDGKWQARFDYTFTRGFGNTEGQVRSDFGQQDVSKTEDWDSWQLMQGQNGELFNVRKHQFRFRGAYQVTPEWLISGMLLAQSGVPEECLGYYGPHGTDDPSGYGGNYHWCGGKIVHPGYKHTPWTKPLNLSVRYAPAFADHKLAFNVDVFNVFNEQKATQTDPQMELTDPGYVSNTFHAPVYFEDARYVRLSVSYDY